MIDQEVSFQQLLCVFSAHPAAISQEGNILFGRERIKQATPTFSTSTRSPLEYLIKCRSTRAMNPNFVHIPCLQVTCKYNKSSLKGLHKYHRLYKGVSERVKLCLWWKSENSSEVSQTVRKLIKLLFPVYWDDPPQQLVLGATSMYPGCCLLPRNLCGSSFKDFSLGFQGLIRQYSLIHLRGTLKASS